MLRPRLRAGLGAALALDARVRPLPFDCLEFSEELGSIHGLYDLAFLVMDLLEPGDAEPARRLLQAYNDRTIEDEGLALMPLFLSLRAVIRAKVAGLTALASNGEAGHEEEVRRARAYLAFARAALAPAPARLVAIGGRSGTGKSTPEAAMTPGFGAAPGATLLRCDVIRKRQLDRQPTERLPVDAYDAATSARVHACMTARAATLLVAGRSLVCDAVHGDPAERRMIAEVAARLGASFAGFWLEARKRCWRRGWRRVGATPRMPMSPSCTGSKIFRSSRRRAGTACARSAPWPSWRQRFWPSWGMTDAPGNQSPAQQASGVPHCPFGSTTSASFARHCP